MTDTTGEISRLAGTLLDPARMAGLRVAVVGLGALGSEVFRLLGLGGAGDVLIVDPDSVEPANRTHSTLYTAADAGRMKTEVLLERGAVLFPRTRITTVAGEVADAGWGRFEGRQLIFGCVDRDSARLEMARIGTRLNLPVCDGGLGGGDATVGRVSWFPGAGGACFGCRLTAARRRELLREWRSQPHPCVSPGVDAVRPSTPVIAAVTGALMVDWGLRTLPYGRGSETDAHTIEVRLGTEPVLEGFSMPRSDACPFHSVESQPLVAIEGTFRASIAGGMTAGWEWPVCMRAKCLQCGVEFSPRVRVARMRSSGRCPSCGSERLLAMEAIQQIGPESPYRDHTPEGIGLPADHRYTIWDKNAT